MRRGVESIGSLFSSGNFSVACEPDNAPVKISKPRADFVLCRSANGQPTAIYGQSVWDFNPYRLSANKISRICFIVFDDQNDEQNALVEEAKYLLYCLIYFGGGGRLGKLSVATLYRYWGILRGAMQFCYAQKQKPIVGVLSLQQLFSIPVYLAASIREQFSGADRTALSGLLSQLVRVGPERIGYAVLNPNHLNLRRPDSKQYPVIPTRIYLNLINVVGDLLDQLYEGIGSYQSFVKAFSDEHYGINLHNQKSRGLGGKSYYRPDMAQALREHGLENVLVDEFRCDFKKDVQTVLLKIQHLAKTVIHLYTGMREQEVMRMSYSCLSSEIARPPVIDDHGLVRDQPLTVMVISSTTKFTGYKKEGTWYAPAEVIKAVEVAQAVCRGLASLYGVNADASCPLFLSPSIVGYSRKTLGVNVTQFKNRSAQLRALRGLRIQAEDLLELAQSDPSRDFYNESIYSIGNSWPLTSHQFRRSLAFYGSSSGFVSLPALRSQFKHMTIQMARYYANNFENLRTIFGYYDPEKKDFVLPSNHFAFELQMAMPMSVANQLIADLLFSEEPLFGGTGSYVQKQKQRLESGVIHIEDIRAETLQRVKDGAISYRPTLLGGCSKVGRCDFYLLGDYSECLVCEAAVIKPQKLVAAIEAATQELTLYAEGSGEYQIVKSEVERMRAFKSRLIDLVEL